MGPHSEGDWENTSRSLAEAPDFAKSCASRGLSEQVGFHSVNMGWDVLWSGPLACHAGVPAGILASRINESDP